MKTVFKWVGLALVSVFFLYAGGAKLVDVASFTQAIEQYRLVNGYMAWILALAIPWTECVAAVLVWLPRVRQGALIVLMGLLAIFQIALLSALFRGLDISCGCLGSGVESSILFAFTRNILIMTVLSGILFIQTKRL